ncbi:chemotaxis protein methyltransferase CheR [uncultured Gammaproteobacteria bacterium]
MNTNQTPFLDLIKRRSGLNCADDRRAVLETALAQRMVATELKTGDQYFAHLTQSDQEFNHLISLLTNNETYFFRESQQLDLIVTRLVPRLLAKPGRTLPLRILSAACSSGEEPYSIVMALREQYGDAVRSLFSVVGSDIDHQALTKAREGRYSEFSFRGVSQQLKDRYFTKKGREYTVLKDIRDAVHFKHTNLIDDTSSTNKDKYNIILIRNTTIYFDNHARRTTLNHLCKRLSNDGCLLVGMAETLANNFGLMELVEEDGIFYFTHANDTPTSTFPLPSQPLLEEAEIPTTATSSFASETENLSQATRLTLERRYDLALRLIRSLTTTQTDAANLLKAHLLKAHIHLNRKEFVPAETEARKALVLEPWSIDAFLVLGLVAHYGERPQEALTWLKQAVYANHGCWPAHYYLANLHRAANNLDLARTAYRVALNLLSTGSVAETGLKVLLPAFPTANIRFLCEHNLNRLGPPSPVFSHPNQTAGRG